MRSLRVVANRALWRFGLRDVLPGYYVQRIPVQECGEPLEPIPAAPGRLLLDPRLHRPHLARRSVVAALRQAAELLPDEIQLLVVDAYRSSGQQQQLWLATRDEIAGKHPLATPSEIDRLTRLVVARPGRAGGGHQTGAAVDITLADAAGTELWMGTDVGEFTVATPTRVTATDTVRWRRELLTRCLTEVGFINYPAEWWHFSMGDRLWAAYERRPAAHFGPWPSGSPPRLVPAGPPNDHCWHGAGRRSLARCMIKVGCHRIGLLARLWPALARVRGRQDDAVIAFRRAEQIHPHRVQRDPFAREVLAELLLRSRRDALGRELRGMAYRAGLPS